MGLDPNGQWPVVLGKQTNPRLKTNYMSLDLFARLHIERETLEGKFAVFIQDRLRLRLLFYFYLRPSPSASMRVPHSEAQSLERWRLRDRLYAAEMRVTCLQRH